MAIHLKEVKTAQDLKAFIYLPEKIHKNHKNWLHPLYMDEKTFFNPQKNPRFQDNDVILLLAYENDRPVGRIMGIIPREFNAHNQVKTARFCFMESEENKEVFDLLLEAIEQWAKTKNADKMVGPMGFSDKEPQGFLTKGFDEKTMLVTNCSFEYMKDYLEANAYRPLVELCQYDVPLSEDIINRYKIFAERVERNQNLKVHEFTKTKEIKPFVQRVFDLVNSTYTNIYGFTKVSKEEADDFANRFIPLLNPRLVKLITDEEDKVVAFVVAMPDLSNAIRKAKGRLFPLGWFHILRGMKTSKRLQLLLGAVKNDMKNKGLDAVLGVKLIRSAIDLGFTMMDSHLIMQENTKMRREIERLENHKLYKEYTIYSKEL